MAGGKSFAKRGFISRMVPGGLPREKAPAPSMFVVQDPTTGDDIYVDKSDPKIRALMLSGKLKPPKRGEDDSSFLDAPVSGRSPETAIEVSNADMKNLRKLQEAKKLYGGNVNVNNPIKRTVK